MPDAEDVIRWMFTTALVLVIAGFVVLMGWMLIDGIGTARDKDRCGQLGGKVEFYDHDHPTLWRCVGATAEGK